jgi:hypothetical protein
MVLFGSYTYSTTENAQFLPTTVWANGQAYRGNRKSEALLGNLMLTYQKQLGTHFLDVLSSKKRFATKMSDLAFTVLPFANSSA